MTINYFEVKVTLTHWPLISKSFLTYIKTGGPSTLNFQKCIDLGQWMTTIDSGVNGSRSQWPCISKWYPTNFILTVYLLYMYVFDKLFSHKSLFSTVTSLFKIPLVARKHDNLGASSYRGNIHKICWHQIVCVDLKDDFREVS
jgi:hypothetical protein